MDPVNQNAPQLRDALKGYFEQVRFARAAELARSGRYLEAEGLLSPNGRESSDPKALDLLARISAQQRMYGRARQLWGNALRQEPGNANYERAIQCTRDAERFQARLRKAALTALLGLSLTALAFAVWSYFHQPSPAVAKDIRPASTPPPGRTTPQPAPTPLQPEPVAPQPTPKPPQPEPTAPQPAPTPPQPEPTAPQPTPTPPQPEPAAPQPTPTPPQPEPAAPQPTPTPPQPEPAAPQPAPKLPQPEPAAPQPAPTPPQPEPAAPQPVPSQAPDATPAQRLTPPRNQPTKQAGAPLEKPENQ
jgi:hypothetical protein